MRIAALTFVYNEAVNLPIWRSYYGGQFGDENLFIIDRASDDGSTDDMGAATVLRLPHTPFDDTKKAACMSAFQAGLLTHYDAVVCGDCDEIVVADPEIYSGLVEYVSKMDGDYATCCGVDVLHVIDREGPIDMSRPILSQRSFGRFQSVGCKTLMTRIPIKWVPGLHACDKRPAIDPHLINFHLKWMDYGLAVNRQTINQTAAWSDAALAARHGAHHRYGLGQFVREGFLDSVNAAANHPAASFRDLLGTIDTMNAGDQTEVARFVEIPERFASCV